MTQHESWHLFIAPLYLETKRDLKRVDASEYAETIMGAIMKDSRFKLKPRLFSVETPGDYGAFQYFFEDARRSIFWFKSEGHDKDGVIRFRLNASDAPYNQAEPQPIGDIHLRVFGNNEGKSCIVDEVQLELMDVDVTFYKFDVGHVSFLCRYRQPIDGFETEELFYKRVLMINNRMRRLYLPWLAKGMENVPKEDIDGRISAQVEGDAPYNDIKLSIRDSFANCTPEENAVILEDYRSCLSYETLNINMPNRPVLLETVLGKMSKHDLACSFELLDDNLMFTVAYVLVDHLDTFLDVSPWGELDNLNPSQRWHRLLTVDGSQRSMITSYDPLRIQTVKNCTYTRWMDPIDPQNSTLFGCTRHSFIMIGSRRNSHFRMNLRSNFLHQHGELARVVLAQTAAVHRFGRVAHRLSGKITKNNDAVASRGLNQEVFQEASDFKQDFNDFINRLMFHEITSQQQGTELYRMLQVKLEVNVHLSEISDEINQLFNHMEMLQRQSQEKSIKQLTQTSIMLGVLAFLTGFYGSNFFAIERGNMMVDHRALSAFALVLAVTLLGASFTTILSSLPFAIGDRILKLFGK